MQLNQKYWKKNNFIAKTLNIFHIENVLRLLKKQKKNRKQNLSKWEKLREVFALETEIKRDREI